MPHVLPPALSSRRPRWPAWWGPSRGRAEAGGMVLADLLTAGYKGTLPPVNPAAAVGFPEGASNALRKEELRDALGRRRIRRRHRH